MEIWRWSSKFPLSCLSAAEAQAWLTHLGTPAVSSIPPTPWGQHDVHLPEKRTLNSPAARTGAHMLRKISGSGWPLTPYPGTWSLLYLHYLYVRVRKLYLVGLGPPFELLDILLSWELDLNPQSPFKAEFHRPRSTHDNPLRPLHSPSHHLASTGPCFVSSATTFLFSSHTPQARKQGQQPRPAPTVIMAVARPVRVLGLAAVMMWCFFLYQVFKPGVPIPLPSGIPKNEKEPLLDRELLFLSLRLTPLRPDPASRGDSGVGMTN